MLLVSFLKAEPNAGTSNFISVSVCIELFSIVTPSITCPHMSSHEFFNEYEFFIIPIVLYVDDTPSSPTIPPTFVFPFIMPLV